MDSKTELEKNDKKLSIKSENNGLVGSKEIKNSDTSFNKLNNVINNAIEEKKSSTLFWLLPSISTFVGISTLLKSNFVWLGVALGFFIAVVNAYALYRHDKQKTCQTSGLLIILEISGIMCLTYDAIQGFHKNVPASLPQPFDHYSDQIKMWFGIGLLTVAIFLSFVLIYLENCKSTAKLNNENNDRESNSSNEIAYTQMIVTGGIVFMGTYPLMINFFIGLNHGLYTSWLMGITITVALCSSTAQAILITVKKDKNDSEPDRAKEKRKLIIEWFGKFFMSVEIILSLANTAFSNSDSSVDECLKLLNSNWVEKNSRSIGLGLFIIASVIFIVVTYQHFKKSPIKTAAPMNNSNISSEDNKSNSVTDIKNNAVNFEESPKSIIRKQ